MFRDHRSSESGYRTYAWRSSSRYCYAVISTTVISKYVEPFYKYLKTFLWLVVLWHVMGTNQVLGDALPSKTRKTAFIPGDILIGALVSVHHQPMKKTASLLECGEIREQYGIQRVEAAFLAIDRINEDPNILPSIKLGIEIRDSCWYSSIALEQSIEFIRDAITGPDGGHNLTKHPFCPKAVSPASKNLVGVVGPGSSTVTIQVQNLLQLFRIPQVGYSATSRDLSDKSRFSYFLRVVPSDYHQAQVMVDIVKNYNWTYVSAVHTDGNYGQSGMVAFRELADANNICIAEEDTVLSNAEKEAFDEVIKNLSEDNRANVVICFCEGMTVRNLLLSAQRLGKLNRFLFIGSDGWADRHDVVTGIEEAAEGGLSVKIQSSYVAGFDEHYFNLSPDNNTRNPWFKEFWAHRFNCTFTEDGDNDTKTCTGEEQLSDRYKQDTKMADVVKAIYTMAYGLHNLHVDVCKGKPGICREMLPVNGSLLMDYLLNVTFTYGNETVTFDSRGDPPGRYEIMNYQKLPNGSYDYVKVGSWNNGSFALEESLVVFKGASKEPPISVCSTPCTPGQVKSFIDTGDDTHKCCWICDDCEQDEYLETETTCTSCGRDHWPNSTKTGCDPIPVEYLDWTDSESIAALTIASLGLIATFFATAVFINKNHTPVVKASNRELTYIIFMGMMVSYLTSLPLLHRPTTGSCALSRIMPGLSFTMIYAALVTKTNKIARILARNKKIIIKKHRFMSATAQVGITGILISIEVIIIIIMLIHEPPDAIKSYPRPGKVVMICNTTPLGIIAPLGWGFFLVALCTLYAIKTRNVPENFNEAKFIGFSMYTTCVIWLAWIPIYFGSNHKIISLCICTSLSAFVTLVLLYFPKIFIIILRPEQNTRSSFKTAQNVRCHIGSTTKHLNHSDSKAVQSPTPTRESVFHFPDSKWVGLISRMKGSSPQTPCPPKTPITPFTTAVPYPKTLLTRETSVWSEVSVGPSSVSAQNRESLLSRAYGSQLDLADADNYRWGIEEKGCQTSDELLDPLIPRLRRRVVRAVHEGTLSTAEGREFFSITHGWMQAQEEAARIEYLKMKEAAAAGRQEQDEHSGSDSTDDVEEKYSKKKKKKQEIGSKTDINKMASNSRRGSILARWKGKFGKNNCSKNYLADADNHEITSSFTIVPEENTGRNSLSATYQMLEK